MPRIRYQVAASLDGYIAGPNDETDWIIMDPEIDFEALFAQFDTFIMGRKTFEVTGGGGGPTASEVRTFVFSRTLRQQDFPNVTIVSEVSARSVAPIRDHSVKDIWLFGGGTLFRSFLDAGLVDTVEIAVMPVLLGEGVSLLPAPADRANLTLTGHRVYSSGIVSVEYTVSPPAA